MLGHRGVAVARDGRDLDAELPGRRDVDEAKRREFYRLMVDDTDRLLATVEQVLRAGKAGLKQATLHRVQLDFDQLVRECVDSVRVSYHLQPESLRYETLLNGDGATVIGDFE